MRVDDVVVLGPGLIWVFVFEVREEKVDDNLSGNVDGDPGNGVLAGEARRNFAEVLGACYELEMKRLVTMYGTLWDASAVTVCR